MRPDMNADDARLSRIWDALQAGSESANDDAALLDAIHQIEDVTRVPPPPPELIARTWERLTGASLPLVPYPATAQPAPVISLNGHHRIAAAAIPMRRTRSSYVAMVAVGYRLLAIGVMAGIGAGFIVGVWTRIAMRLAGFFTVDANQGLLTENDAVVGHITFEGTVSIGMFGAVLGVMGGLLYIAIRRWLPGRAWRRSLGYGVLLLAVFGFIIMDPSNPDYRRFGPAWMNVGTFSLAYVLFGILVGTFVEALDRWLPRVNLTGPRKRRFGLVIGLAPFSTIAVLGLLIGGIGIVQDAPLIVLGIGIIVLLSFVAPRMAFSGNIRLPRPALIRYAAFALPALIGFTLTLRSIIEIIQG